MTHACEQWVRFDTKRSDSDREDMVAKQLIGRGIHDAGVLEAMRLVPRHLFVPPRLVERAYDDRPLEIGCGQTISQPFMVATMVELLELRGTERVLEIGTGSGYQTALLACMAAHVYTVERHSALLEPAETRLAHLQLTNVTTLCGDGSEGWFEHAPYDRIIVSASAPKLSTILRNQLTDGGRLVIPIGERDMQDLVLVVRCGNLFEQTTHGTCVFVPLIGQGGWEEEK